MSESRALRYGTIVAAIAASVAALAATAQSYVAWSGRNDALKAILVSAAVQQCSEVSLVADRFYRQYRQVARQLDKSAVVSLDVLDGETLDELATKMNLAVRLLLVIEPESKPNLDTTLDTLHQTMRAFLDGPHTAENFKTLTERIWHFQSTLSDRCMYAARNRVFK